MVFALLLSFLSNQKRILVDFGLVTLLSFIFIQQLRRYWPLLVMIGFAGGIANTFIVPAIQATRVEAKNLRPWERMDVAWTLLESTGFDPARLNEISDQQSEVYQYAFGPSLSYFYPKVVNADRYSLIFPLDQVERRADVSGVPMSLMLTDMVSVLPLPFINKNGEKSGDVIAWTYGIRRYGSIARPVLGAPASAYVFGGMLGLLILPGLTYLLIFSAATIVGGSLRDNPFGIATGAIVVITVEYTVPSLGYFVRPVPVLIFSMLGIRWLSYRMPHYQRWLATRAAGSSNFSSPRTTAAQTSVSTAS